MKNIYKSYFKTGAVLGLSFLLLSLLSIFFMDKTLALHLHQYGVDQWLILSYITECGIPLYFFICIGLLIAIPTSRSIAQRILFVTYVIAIMLLAKWIRVELGIIFGRNWPQTWAGSGSYGSLISDHHYYFHFFESSTFKGSFPSGHLMVITILCCTFYFIYPQFLLLWILPFVLIPVCLILLNYHYLGDCLAGIGLGLWMSYYGFAGYTWLSKQLGVQSHVKN